MRNELVESGESGKLLLRCVRAYVELDLLASFDVHTDQTVEFGREIVNQFVELANVSTSTNFYMTNTNTFVLPSEI